MYTLQKCDGQTDGRTDGQTRSPRHSIVSDVDAPVVTCPRTEAHLYQRNAYLMCEVRAEPAVFVLYWIIDYNGTILVAGQIIREYWTLVSVSQLYFVS